MGGAPTGFLSGRVAGPLRGVCRPPGEPCPVRAFVPACRAGRRAGSCRARDHRQACAARSLFRAPCLDTAPGRRGEGLSCRHAGDALAAGVVRKRHWPVPCRPRRQRRRQKWLAGSTGKESVSSVICSIGYTGYVIRTPVLCAGNIAAALRSTESYRVLRDATVLNRNVDSIAMQ